MSERFRNTWRGWTESSEGYAVRLRGRSNLEFRDSGGTIHISAEAMSKPWNKIVVETQSIPETTDRPRAQVVDRIRRAFHSKGWTMVESQG